MHKGKGTGPVAKKKKKSNEEEGPQREEPNREEVTAAGENLRKSRQRPQAACRHVFLSFKKEECMQKKCRRHRVLPAGNVQSAVAV